jgi:prepilin-type N-terminal cleavage/methylation domain-containing protein
MTDRRSRPSGFTLIEVMISAAIVGLLASVALPEFSRATLRARAAERSTIMDAIERAINELVEHQQAIPANAGTQWVGVANPPGAADTTKRAFNWAAVGWTRLPLIVEGNAYYSYSFVADDPAPQGTNVTLTVTGDGDLDGDGAHSIRTDAYVGNGYSFTPDPVAAHWSPPDPSYREDPTNF